MTKLTSFLARLPATRVLSTSEDAADEAAAFRELLRKEGLGGDDDGDELWWVKLALDIRSHLSWHVIQELGHVLNYLSPSERLPTVFMPTSSPPYMNGGPDEYLHWVIEATDEDVDPGSIAETLIGRLPKPIDDLAAWRRCENPPCEIPVRGTQREG
jgi:hypothetical protein